MNVAMFFAGLGWTAFGRQTINDADLYETSIKGTPCSLNHRLSLHAWHYAFTIHDGEIHESVELELSAEAGDGQWFRIKSHICVADLTAQRVDNTSKRLLAAWEAVQ